MDDRRVTAQSPDQACPRQKHRSGFPPVGQIVPMVFQKWQVEERWPTLVSVLESLRRRRQSPAQVLGVVVPRHVLCGATRDSVDGAALVIVLPHHLESVAERLASYPAHPWLRDNLDYTSASPEFVFCAHHANRNFTVSTSVNAIRALAKQCGGGPESHCVVEVPVVFAAGNSVVCGGILADRHLEDEIRDVEMLATAEHYNPFDHSDSDTIHCAREKYGNATDKAPWVRGLWECEREVTALVEVSELELTPACLVV
jgi:hypothetical protein